jgi:two-component system sensor kinase FixL
VIMDAQGRMELVNPSVCKLFGYKKNELVGKLVEMLMNPADQDDHPRSVGKYLLTSTPRIIGSGREIIGFSKRGKCIPIWFSVSKIRSEKELLFVGILHDMTKEKEAAEYLEGYTKEPEATVMQRTFALEEMVAELKTNRERTEDALNKEKEINQMKTRFVSMASHELRSPLTSIQLCASLIERYYDRLNKSQILNHLKKIKVSVSELINTLDEFLSVEKIESGKVEPVYRSLDLQRFVKGITGEMALLAKKGQVIQYRHTGSKAEFKLDGNLLKHCLANLLTNAIKYSGADGVIQIDTSIDRDNCTISVKDNGIGIPTEDQKNLFTAFFRAQNARDISGTGLGLAIVQRYVKLMKGKINFESSYGMGTVFHITIPLVKTMEPALT